jgi:DNA-binding NtrC family response regulator
MNSDWPGPPPTNTLAGCQAVIVDDDRAVLSLFVRAFREAGCDVVAFSDFLDAKDHLSHSTPDILITDLRLGAFNGLHLVALCHPPEGGVTAIVLTGHDDPVLHREAAAAHALYVVKPVTPEHLLDIVGKARTDR